MNSSTVDTEIGHLLHEIKERLGARQPDGSYTVTFGVLFKDDKLANILEALVGTLRAAKKKKLIKYDGELLLQGVHDKVVVTVLPSA